MNVSSVSHVGIDGAGAAGVFFFTATSPSVAGTRPVVVVSHRKVASPSTFYPPPDGSSLVFGACLLLTFAARWAAADPVQWATSGHWYEAVTSPQLTWEQAGQAAVARSWMSMQGHLATITSQAEEDFLSSVMPAGNYWLAAYQDPWDSPPDQNWHWQTEEPWIYTNWAPREPNDYYVRVPTIPSELIPETPAG